MVEYDFNGQVAFVTGAARGQGRSHAVAYAENGADVVVTDICEDVETSDYPLSSREDLEKTAELVEEEGQEALVIEMDVRDDAEVQAAVEKAVDHFGHIDILANNAGIWNLDFLHEMSEEKWDEMIDIDLKGVWLPSKYVAQHMVERGEGGKIVSTASTAGHGASYRGGHYTAAKHGVVGLTRSLAIELGEYGINVNCVSPTGIDSPMTRMLIEEHGQDSIDELEEYTGKWNVMDEGPVEPRDVSEAYLWLSSDAARYVTGSALPVDAGLMAK
ncbi:short-chain dehydrogenase/reductase SDR [Halodesulfurarchaeum formicicum]|uniref:Short-chain dehydrogenase/reductase SDR n=1 Tax=Halodesulfurarchaeum formicicum TaxID=1873524 RepID=A0A1D8S240_9EURY|nr:MULTISPECIES: mycofactocin-coupled SDR family oxidoreductase [Halodesulfurarchaeum]AOW79425.1 short-chain dehydrogenase/reductase SDR [Halodesulfurarchaeum formicicum]APE94678.1 short-chain dehydrogenase/reductase SDR [Halodesulfurarchaeum formicicum]MDR5655954.1 mycofactocin-coupled SDR family oxidoreductase [Halodesulfurarchaeum sp. HSR-GB]